MLSRLQRPMRAHARAALQRAVSKPTVIASSHTLNAAPLRSFADKPDKASKTNKADKADKAVTADKVRPSHL